MTLNREIICAILVSVITKLYSPFISNKNSKLNNQNVYKIKNINISYPPSTKNKNSDTESIK